MQNDCAEFKIRAEQKAGEFLAEMPKNVGGNPNQLHDATSSNITLQELDIEKTQSYRWQQMASVPIEKREDHIQET